MTEPTRKPIVYLLVFLPILVVGGIYVVLGLLTLYARVAGMELKSIPNLNGKLIGIPTLMLWIPITLLIGNCVLFVVAPLRRVAETYVASAGRPGFLESQWQLAKGAFLFAIICVPLIILGFLF